MRSDVIGYKTLHTWTGLIAGMALFICFFAGALTMFEEPLARWSSPPAAETAAGAQPWVAAENLPALIAATLHAHPKAAQGFMVNLQPQEDIPAPLIWRESGRRAGPEVTTAWATLDDSGQLRSGTFRAAPMAQLMLWVESRRKKQRRNAAPPEQKRNTYWMAAATVGVCWGAVAGVATAMVAGKWLHGSVADPERWYMGVYYTVFLGCVAWAFLRGAARAMVHLLWLCACATLAIPLTGLLALLLPSMPPWLHTAPDLLMVELTALLLGSAFVFMAQRTALRVRHGDVDSVWSDVPAPVRGSPRLNRNRLPCPPNFHPGNPSGRIAYPACSTKDAEHFYLRLRRSPYRFEATTHAHG